MPAYSRKLAKGMRFYYSFTFDNKVYFSRCIYISKKEALSAERERYNQLDEERRFGKQDRPLSLKGCVDDRIKFLSIKYSQKHADDSQYYLELYLDHIGNKEIRIITRKETEDFLLDYSDQLYKNGVDNYQVNSALKCIKSLFNYIIDSNDLTIRNPAQNIKPFPIKKKIKYIPPDDDIDKLKSLVNSRQKLLIDFLMETGCRINEALSLTFEDINENYLIVYTRKSKNSDRVPRKLPIPNCLKGGEGKGRVFPEWNKTPKFLDKTLRANEMRIWGFHSLRHRYASRLSKEGRPIFEIMSLLGHSQLKTTQQYLQMLP